MKIGLLVVIGFFAWSLAYSQSAIVHMTSSDSVLLTNFWDDLKTALNNKDPKSIKRLCEFPFNCSACLDSLDDNKNYILVDNVNFDKGRYRVFFDKELIRTVNKFTMPKDLFIFHSAMNDRNKIIGYEFSYIRHPETQHHPSQQGWITLKKMSGKYKIISFWTIP